MADPNKREIDSRPPDIAAKEACYVVRQPILDRQGKLSGYDLLFRNSPEILLQRETEFALETLLDNQVIFGLERITNGLPAFIICTPEALLEEWVLVLPPASTVLTIPATDHLPLGLEEACESLKTKGFRLALDDLGWHDKPHKLLRLADYVRLDFRLFRTPDREQLLHRLQNSVVKIAKNVETQEDHQEAAKMGFRLFQGEYVRHPVLLRRHKIPANRPLHLGLVRELYHTPLNIKKISDLVRHDASLTYRLLRLVNSPIYALRSEVRSIETAIMVLGDDAFRRAMTLAVLSEINMENSMAILQTVLVRARFCELAASSVDQLDPAEQYLLGMLSLLPDMLGMSMEEIVPTLPLRNGICEALRGRANAERILLGWVECYERADWDECDRLVEANSLDASTLAGCYLEAVRWAGQLSTPVPEN